MGRQTINDLVRANREANAHHYGIRPGRKERRYQAKLARIARKNWLKARREHERKASKEGKEKPTVDSV